MRTWRVRRTMVAGVLAALVGTAGVARAQETRGVVTGRVTDRSTGQPIEGAQVSVIGTTIRALSSPEGAFRLGNVPAGPQVVRVARIGYQASTDTVAVPAGGSATLNVALGAAAVQLGEVVVTATGAEQSRREIPASVGTIQPREQDLATTNNFSELLAARTPGVVVHQSTGSTGGGSRIRIRGSNSVSLSNDPLVIVDGIRLNAAGNSTTLGVGGQQPSRFNDINPEDIEKIDVIKGPAAAALYGTAAANGVIQITTKRGRAGRTRWQLHAEGGTVIEPNEYPANYRTVGQRSATDTTTVSLCSLDQQSRGFCVPRQTLSASPLEQASPFRDGWRESFGMSVDGGADVATYYVGGDYEREQGVYDVNDLRRLNLRANLRGQLRPNLDLTVTTGYLTSQLSRPQNDNNILGIVSSGMLGGAIICSQATPCGSDTTSRGYISGQRPQDIFALKVTQDVERFTGGVNSNWTPFRWLTVVTTAGLDYLSRRDANLVAPGRVFFADYGEGFRTSNPYRIFTYTGNTGATANYQLLPTLSAVTSLGVQYNQETVRGTEAFGARLLGGTESLEGASARFGVGETNTDNITVGGYVQEQLAWRDRLFLTGALRTDRNSAFGQDFGWVAYPSVGASWVVGEESFFPQVPVLSSLRLRASYGTSGQKPSFRDAVTYFDPVAVSAAGGQEVPAVSLGGTGNPDLKPEKSKELELGFDVSFWDERIGLEVTRYDRVTDDALIQVRIAPSVGASQVRFQNIGRVKNNGWEALLNATPLDLPAAKWNITFNASTNKNELEKLGLPAPIIFNGSLQRHTENRPLGAYYQISYTYADKNNDGIISRAGCPGVTVRSGFTPGECEVTLGDTTFLGSPFPEREVSIHNSLTLFRWVTLSGLLDYRGGFKNVNYTERFRCSASFQNCLALNDPKAPVWEQARAVASLMGTDAGYIEDAEFWKLRELAVTLALPERWARAMRGSGLSLTLAGRNLKTWTDYTGLDPEVNAAGQNNFSTYDFLTQPPVRYYTARLNLSF